MSRLNILKASLAKKEALLDAKFKEHFATVKQANGQPLNDKKNGRATLAKWDRQNDGIRAAEAGIEATKQAIDREEAKITKVENCVIPDFFLQAIEAGIIARWRKFPNRFFVSGVEKGRIIWDEKKQAVLCSYVSEIPKNQYSKFRDVFNELKRQNETR